MITAVVRALIAQGASPEMILAAVEAAEQEMLATEQARKAKNRDRMRSVRERARTENANVRVVREQSAQPPDKESSPTPPKEINPSSLRSDNNIRARETSPKAELETVLDAERAEAVLDHRRRLRKPLTVHAAKLLATKFARCRDPRAAADAMIANGWQGFEPEWLDNRNGTRNGNGTHQGSGKPRPHDTILAAIARKFAPGDGLGERQANADGGLPDQPGAEPSDRSLDIDLPPTAFRRA